MSQISNFSKISIVVPCYNRERYLKECVDSLLSQTYPKEWMEFIFVDDGSTDATVDMLKEYEAKYPENILIVELLEHSGGRPGYVRNVGMQYVSGDFLMFVDSDDIVDVHIVERLYETISITNADIVAACKQKFYENQILLSEEKGERTFDTTSDQELVDLLALEGGNAHVGAKLYRIDFLRENNIWFPEDRSVSEDVLFTMVCLLKLHRFSTISDVLYYYRHNPDGIWWDEHQPPEQVFDCLKTQEELLPIYRQRLSGIYEVVEWFFFQAVDLMRARWMDLGQQEYYRSVLPYIRDRLNACVPNITSNRIIRQNMTADTRELFWDLYGYEMVEK